MPTAIRAEPRWFLDNLVRLHDGGLVELTAAQGDMPPLHIHRTEDELFYVLEGELSFFVGGDTTRARVGETAFGPAAIPHVYRVESEQARWLAFTTHGHFAALVSAVSRPAAHDGLPPHTAPTPEQVETLNRIAAEQQIEIIAPPGTLPS